MCSVAASKQQKEEKLQQVSVSQRAQAVGETTTTINLFENKEKTKMASRLATSCRKNNNKSSNPTCVQQVAHQ